MLRTIIAAVVCFSGVSKAAAPATQPAPPTNVSKYKVIVHVVSRDHTVTISAGPKGPVYSLTQAGGKVLVADASGAEFEKLQPELYRHIRGYIAVQNDEHSAVGEADASIEGPIPLAYDSRR